MTRPNRGQAMPDTDVVCRDCGTAFRGVHWRKYCYDCTRTRDRATAARSHRSHPNTKDKPAVRKFRPLPDRLEALGRLLRPPRP